MIVAIDLGLKRIGVAAAPDDKTPLPCEPILRKNRTQAARELSELLREKGAGVLVLGVPRGGASEEEMSRRIRHFASLLDFDGEIKFQDESFSSAEAAEFASKGAKGGGKDARFDSIAATIILQRFLASKG